MNAGRTALGLVVVCVVVALFACGGDGDGQATPPGQLTTTQPTTPATDEGTTSTTSRRTTTTEPDTTSTTEQTTTTSTNTEPDTTTPTTRRPTTTAPTTTQAALPAAPTEPATSPASTSKEGDTGLWWLLLLLVIVVGVIAWWLSRPKSAPIDERWRAQVEQFATDGETVSHLLVAGADPAGPIADDRWSGVLTRSQEVRGLAPSLAPSAPTAEHRDSITAVAEALRSLEISADAARLHVVGAANAARNDADRVGAALFHLRELLNPAVASQP